VRGSAHSCGSSARAAIHQAWALRQTRRRSGGAARRANNSPGHKALIRCCPWPNPSGRPGVHEQKHSTGIARCSTTPAVQRLWCSAHTRRGSGEPCNAAVALCAVAPENRSECSVAAVRVARRSVSARAFQALLKLQRAGTGKGSSFPCARPFTNQARPLFCAVGARSTAAVRAWRSGFSTSSTSSTLIALRRLTGGAARLRSTSGNARGVVRRGRRRAPVVTPHHVDGAAIRESGRDGMTAMSRRARSAAVEPKRRQRPPPLADCLTQHPNHYTTYTALTSVSRHQSTARAGVKSSARDIVSVARSI
jgi:hypothetical protein